MSRKIVEAVPNISEGQNKELINEVVNAASKVTGSRVLDVDPGAATTGPLSQSQVTPNQ